MKHIEYFDCRLEDDRLKSEQIIQNKRVEKCEIVDFPHIMLIWEGRIEYFDCASELDNQRSEIILKNKSIIKCSPLKFPHLMLIWDDTPAS